MLTQRQLFLQHLAQTSPAPLALEIESAEGLYLTDSSGKKYLDLISGISVSNIGHRHPKVLKAIQNQLDKYMHLMVYGEYIQAPQVKLAKLLSDNLPSGLDSTYFVNSGSEAVEGALKLAKRYIGRTEIVSCLNAYHGSSHGALSIMGNEELKQPFRPLLPAIRHIEFNNTAHLDQITTNTACVIMETVQGEAGIIVPDKDYMKAVRKKCDETGALLILDEIQTGFGRTGTLFGFEQYDIVPDIMTIAKGMGGGMPIGAFISSQEIMSSLSDSPALGHITTFGGHPVSCAASHATLEVLLEEKLIESVAEKEALFKKLLQHPKINKIKSKGLLIGIEFDSEDFCKKVIENCLENGIITDWFLFSANTLRIAPPLTISEEEIEHSCNIILNSIQLL